MKETKKEIVVCVPSIVNYGKTNVSKYFFQHTTLNEHKKTCEKVPVLYSLKDEGIEIQVPSGLAQDLTDYFPSFNSEELDDLISCYQHALNQLIKIRNIHKTCFPHLDFK